MYNHLLDFPFMSLQLIEAGSGWWFEAVLSPLVNVRKGSILFKSRLRIPLRKSTRLRLKSEFLAEGSKPRISRRNVQNRCFHRSVFDLYVQIDFFNRIGR